VIRGLEKTVLQYFWVSLHYFGEETEKTDGKEAQLKIPGAKEGDSNRAHLVQPAQVHTPVRIV
jgi:hypothetical protein